MDIVLLTLASPFEGYERDLKLDRLNKINVFIGKNNSGKTQLLHQIYKGLNQGYEANQVLKKISLRFKYPLEKEELEKLLPQDSLWSISLKEGSRAIIDHHSDNDSSLKISKAELFRTVDDIIKGKDWERVSFFLTFKKHDKAETGKDSYILEIAKSVDADKVLLKLTCSNLVEPNNIFNTLISLGKAKFLPALRILGGNAKIFDEQTTDNIGHFLDIILNSGFSSLNEINPEVFLIPDLHLLIKHINENEYDQLDQAFVKRFNTAVNSLVPNISLKLEYKRSDSVLNYIEFDSKVENWKQLGNGTQQLISLLFLFLLPGDFVYLVDEPEIGLHPGLQTKFLYFLQEMVLSQEKYSKQFFFATHSTSFIDFNLDTSHYICEKTEYTFKVDYLERDELNVIKDVLGLSPGALLQANGIIWVEGPSDRNYLTLFDEIFNLNLKQNGILIRMTFSKDNVLAGHLTPKMFESSNSNFMVILDSDKESIGEELDWKERKLIERYGRKGHLVYIPQDWRDIEGLLPQSVLNAYFRIDTHDPKFRKKEKFEKLDSYIHELKNKHLVPDEVSGYNSKFHDSKRIVEMVLSNKELREDIRTNSNIKEFIGMIKNQIKKWIDHPNLFNSHRKRGY